MLTLRDLAGRRAGVRVFLLAVSLVLGLTVTAHHSGLGEHEMGAMHGDHAAAVATCLGIAVGAVTVVGLVLVRRIRRRAPWAGRPRVRRAALVSALTPAVWVPPPRAGPNLSLHLCVDRR